MCIMCIGYRLICIMCIGHRLICIMCIGYRLICIMCIGYRLICIMFIGYRLICIMRALRAWIKNNNNNNSSSNNNSTQLKTKQTNKDHIYICSLFSQLSIKTTTTTTATTTTTTKHNSKTNHEFSFFKTVDRLTQKPLLVRVFMQRKLPPTPPTPPPYRDSSECVWLVLL